MIIYTEKLLPQLSIRNKLIDKCTPATMYKSTALLLVSLLSLTIAGPITEQCRNIKTTHQFNPVKYFGKTWYVTNALFANVKFTPDDDVACMKLESNLLANGIVRVIDATYVPKNRTYLYSESYVNLADFMEGTGEYISVARPIDNQERPLVKDFYPLKYNIVYTDYDNQSFLYICVKIPNGKVLSIYNVLRRDSGARPLDGNILSIIKELGLKADDFVQIDNENCKED